MFIESVYDKLVRYGERGIVNLTDVKVIKGEKLDSATLTTTPRLFDLANIAHNIRLQGFHAFEYTANGKPITSNTERATERVEVYLTRAEDKLKRTYQPSVPEDSPDYSDDIIATGPLVREFMMDPRRVVLRQLKGDKTGDYGVSVQSIPDGIGDKGRPNYGFTNYTKSRHTAFRLFIDGLLKMDEYANPELYASEV